MKNAKICTISMDGRLHGSDVWEKETALAQAEEKILSAWVDKPDLFLLPEAFLTGLADQTLNDPKTYESQGNAIYQKFSELARHTKAYIAVPMLTQNNQGRHNSTVLFDRKGNVVFTYHKAYLTQAEIEKNILPGTTSPKCYDTDFGCIGIAICFDLQFQPLFKHYHQQGMELLLFPSYFPGGFMLRSLAFMYSFFAVSSHAQGEESVFIDNYGLETARAGLFSLALTQTINLDCMVLPIAPNLAPLALLKQKYNHDAVEVDMHRPEGRMILRSVSHEMTVEKLKKEFGLTSFCEFYQNKNLC